ncbi:hypothetical protein BC833DRAFT_570321 [Globomyces pollinis-pini]|nr:hypothetical protein BC833DRAFT_570321 [Globomyces pollinis-pini]
MYRWILPIFITQKPVNVEPNPFKRTPNSAYLYPRNMQIHFFVLFSLISSIFASAGLIPNHISNRDAPSQIYSSQPNITKTSPNGSILSNIRVKEYYIGSIDKMVWCEDNGIVQKCNINGQISLFHGLTSTEGVFDAIEIKIQPPHSCVFGTVFLLATLVSMHFDH